jgi:hypothetical protein
MTFLRNSLAALSILFLAVATAHGGMPDLLPVDFQYIWQLTDSTEARLQAISFFLVALLLSTAVFRWVWNSLQVQFPRLPRISFSRALGLIFVWGMLAIVVLTMISGARELMTPGAWEKQGLTHKLAKPDDELPGERHSFSLAERKAALQKLKQALWAYAVEHDRQFPASADEIEPKALWQIPGAAKLRFIYLPPKPGETQAPFLVYEPDFAGHQRLMLSPEGEIHAMHPNEFNQWRYPELHR